MGRTNQKPIQPSRIRQLHERAVFFRRLADGAGDHEFARKLQGLIEEYERDAVQAASQSETSATPRSLDDSPVADMVRPTA